MTDFLTELAEPVEQAELERLQKDCGIPHLPTQLTYHLRLAPSQPDAPFLSWGYQWADKPHRLLYTACGVIEEQADAILAQREEKL